MVAQLPPPPPHERPLHRSLNCRVPTGVAFVNETGHTVQVVWLSYTGAPHLYMTLPPGTSTTQYTYAAHPWCFRATTDPAAVLTVDSQPVWYAPPPQRPLARACIREAPRQPWCPALHQHTPPAFQASVRALLLSHRRLARGGVPPPPPRAPPTGRMGAWAGRLRSALRWGAWQQPPYERVVRQAEEARHALNLGHLPEELLLKVMAAAAPSVPVLVKPALPAGVDERDLSPEARELLFRQDEAEEGSSSSGRGSRCSALGRTASGGDSWRQQQRDVPAEQLAALQQQQEYPAPAPVGVPHPLQVVDAPAAPPAV